MRTFEIRSRALGAGVASFLPGVRRLTNRASGGTDSARYCYSVWLRHLVRAHSAGLGTNPECVAELGPGDSLGIGLAALLCGGERYIALDVKRHANPDTNLRVFEEMVTLFRGREAIPDDVEFPAVQPKLSDYRFPSYVLSEERLAAALAKPRLEQIRAAITGQPCSVSVSYKAPWTEPSVIVPGSVDFLLSQAVLEHVDNLDLTYGAMREWMKPGASMSHSIDFTSHNLTRSWNGHWTVGDGAWKLVRGTRSYLINRQPLSCHLTYLSRYGFEPVSIERRRGDIGESFRPAIRFRDMSPEDACTRGVFLQARVGARVASCSPHPPGS
jgi:hypothetical protein